MPTLSVRVDAKPQVKARRSGYIPTLDGWRTIAVLAVIAFHAPVIHVGRFSLNRLQEYGDRGVQLFFAISGVLICSRLLEEQRMHGSISLRASTCGGSFAFSRQLW